MKLSLIRPIAILLVMTTLVGCKSKNFDYVETTVPAEEETLPWQNSDAFTYTPSEDGVSNVINWNQAREMMIADDMLYLYGHWRAIRYNPQSGILTELCTDPLCTHQLDSECPVGFMDSTGMRFTVMDDRVIFYEQKPSFGDSGPFMQYDLYLYSMTDRTTKLLRSFQEFGSEIIALPDAFFFQDAVYDAKKDTYIHSLCRQEYDSDQPEILRTQVDDGYWLRGTNGEVIYIYDEAQGAMITLSLDGKTEIARAEIDRMAKVAVCKDGYMIYEQDDELFRMNADGSDQHSLGITGVRYFYLTDSYIYYQKIDGEKRYHDLHNLDDLHDDETVFVQYESIYRTDHQGKNEELVYRTTAEDTVIVSTENFVVLGNYLYAPFYYVTIDKEEEKASSSYSRSQLGDTQSYSYCRIDLTTGEIYFIDTPL